ncbi:MULTISPECIES: hypothetical protein [Leptolyngbya]|nr:MULTISPECIES: hypothetical protein [Leptolyngbya]
MKPAEAMELLNKELFVKAFFANPSTLGLHDSTRIHSIKFGCHPKY